MLLFNSCRRFIFISLCVRLNRQGRRKKPGGSHFLQKWSALFFQICIIFAVRSCILFYLSCWMSSANSLIWIFVVFVVLIELVGDHENWALFSLLLGRIHLRHTLIAVAFARKNLFCFFSSKTTKNSNGRTRRLFTYAANECALNNLTLSSAVFDHYPASVHKITFVVQ